MSRIGKKSVSVPAGVEIQIDGQTVSAKGSKGQLQIDISPLIQITHEKNIIRVKPIQDTQESRTFWGLSRSLIQNIIVGVSEGFSKKIEIQGVGYRAQMQGNTLKLALGFSHEILYTQPSGIKIDCPSQTEIIVSGTDRQKVGQVAAEIRRYRPPEPYKGKGVRYEGEYVFRKEGKKK